MNATFRECCFLIHAFGFILFYDKFCYLGDMLSQEGGYEHAILKRIQTGWLRFRELSGLLIGKVMSVKSKGIIYITCIRPAMLYGSETWLTKGGGYKENTEE